MSKNCHSNVINIGLEIIEEVSSTIGKTGPDGNAGSFGATGLSNNWSVAGGTSHSFRLPIERDLQLDLEDCQISRYNKGQWNLTGQRFPICLDKDQITDCLRELKLENRENYCSLILSLDNCSSLFYGGLKYQILKLIILGQDLTHMFDQNILNCFDRPEQLADILSSINWKHQEILGQHFFVTEVKITDPNFKQLENSISFNLKPNQLINNQPIKNLYHIEKQYDFNLTLQCQSKICTPFESNDYILVCHTGASSDDILNENPYSSGLIWIPTTSITGVGITGPIGLHGPQGEMGVTGSIGVDGPDAENVFECLNEVELIDCDSNTDLINTFNSSTWSLLANTDQELGWIPAECLLLPKIDLPAEISNLPFCDNLNYADSNLKPLFLIKDNGLTGATGYRNCTEQFSILDLSEDQIEDQVKLASPSNLFDAINYCQDVIYTCTANAHPNEIINKLQNEISSPWKINEIIISNSSQSIGINSYFSSELQLTTIFDNLLWTFDAVNNNYIKIINLPIGSQQSWITFSNDLNHTLIIPLETICNVDCSSLNIISGSTGINRYIFTKIDADNYCWMHANCFDDLFTPQISNCIDSQIDLNLISDCTNVIPEYDLRITLRPNVINLIQNHFGDKNSTQNFWIYAYQIIQTNQIDQSNYILTRIPLFNDHMTLQNLARTFIDGLGWLSDIDPLLINDSTDKVELLLNNSQNLITGILINLDGQNGQNLPFNFNIPIQSIDRVECHNFPLGAKLLIKSNITETGMYCWVDLNCVVPKTITPPNLIHELCNIDDPSRLNDCDTLLNNTGPQIESPIYENCFELNDASLTKLITIFGDTNLLQIIGYQLVSNNESQCLFDMPIDIGINPTFNELINAFITINWETLDAITQPVTLTQRISQNIQYIIINQNGGDPDLPPYPYLIGVNCTTQYNFPSTDPENLILIKGSNLDSNDLCWTHICPILGDIGATGYIGSTGFNPPGYSGGLGMIGITGPLGFQGEIGFQGIAPMGVQGDIGIQGEIGDLGVQGNFGLVGQTGLRGARNTAIDQNVNNLGTGAELFIQNIAPTGATGSIDFGFRTIESSGINISNNVNLSELQTSVSDIFNWNQTIFSGTTGAEVQNDSNLTFLNSSNLFTNLIEPNIDGSTGPSIQIDSSNGDQAIIIRDGGIEFCNDPICGASGATQRDDFLDYYQSGSFQTDWVMPVGGAIFTEVQLDTTLKWERIGNVVNLQIPPIIPVNPSGITGTNDIIIINGLLPEPIRTGLGKLHVQPYLFNTLGETGPFTNIFERRYGACTIADGTIILSYSLDNSTGFPNTRVFQSAESININYMLR